MLAPIYREDPDAAGLVLEAAKETGKLSAASMKQAAAGLGQHPTLPGISSTTAQQRPALPAAAAVPRLSTPCTRSSRPRQSLATYRRTRPPCWNA
ncbi:hypothetical protein ACTU45_32085 [Streptomyces sp. 24-1644]|uniref:hypothetical protein n=1 Tax=Streptomyces sp. 24-1644 TaxID=3457315 RepID=UPI003FA6C83F